MATPIKETPILTGASADRFIRIAEENHRKKVTKEEYDRAKTAYENFEVIETKSR